jgi:hypothetical protein
MSTELKVSSWMRSDLITNWTGQVEPHTQGSYEAAFKAFLIWYEHSPEELLELGRLDYEEMQEKVLAFVNSEKSTFDTKKFKFRTIVAFCRFHKVRGDPIRLKFRNLIEQAGSNLTKTIVCKTIMYDELPIKYKSSFMWILYGLMGLKEWKHSNITQWPKIKTQLDEGRVPIKVMLPAGRKETKKKKPAGFTFEGGLAVDIFREYLASREMKLGEPIWISRQNNPLSIRMLQHAWTLYLHKANPNVKPELETRNSGLGLHKLRRVSATKWREAKADIGAREWCMAHTVDPLSIRGGLGADVYDDMPMIEGFIREEYEKAVAMIDSIFTGQ